MAGLLRTCGDHSPSRSWDMGDLFNFPSQHHLNLSGAAGRLISHADVILCLDVFDLQQALTTTDRVNSHSQ